MEDSIEDAVVAACMGLCGHRFKDMKDDQYRFLPRQHPELEWAIMDPQGMDPTTHVMVRFGYESAAKIHRLEVLTQNVTHCAPHTASRKAWLQLGARVLRDPETCQSV